MKLKTKLLLLIFVPLLTGGQLWAQEYYREPNNTEIEIQDNISRANFSLQGIYYSFEKKLAPFMSLYSDLGMGAVFGKSSAYGYRWAISPTVATEGRWYFNYKRRSKQGQKLWFNAADFLSLQGGYVFKPIERQSFAYIDSGYFLLANIGMQRTWGKHINFELKIGFGAAYSDEYNSGGFTYNFNLKFGYIFNRKF